MKLKDVKVGMRVACLNDYGDAFTRATVSEVYGVNVYVRDDDGGNRVFSSNQLRRLVPKRRKPRELWVNFYKKDFFVHRSKEDAKECTSKDAIETAVHFREVIE